MVAPSKKLTVSFGAFACTLEGFDDPFPVMRQVVDYFQALASADPSFGAHPERPDTDYLKTLAQESTGGTVEAELSEGGMILRQSTGEELAPTLEAIEEPAETIAEPLAPHKSADTLMAEALEDQLFEDVDTLLEQSSEPLNEAQFEDVEEDFTLDLQEEDENRAPVLITEEDMQGAGLPAWAQDLIEDKIEHGAEIEAEFEDPIEQEEEALARVLKAEEERTQTKPELDRANPLTQLREDLDEDQEPLVLSHKPITEDFSEAVDQAPTAQDVDDIFRAFAGPLETDEPAPISAADILREEAIEEIPEPSAEKKTLTATASTKVNGGAMRLSFKGKLPTPIPQEPQISAAQEDAEPLLLTSSQKVEHNPPLVETPTLTIVPEEESTFETDVSLSGDLNSFAASVGAATLPELLEASAAYVTLVSGRSTFSRRDIMTLLDEMTQEQEFTQEARIKSFGKLLRGGSILRTEDGQFAISDRALNTYEAKAGVA